MIDNSALNELVNSTDPWHAWRAKRLLGGDAPMPPIPYQDELGGALGPSDQPSPGATGEFICHLEVLGAGSEAAAVIAADWLADMRTPAMAWLDRPDDVPGDLDTPGGARVWATASATCGLLVAGRDPGSRAFDLLRGESDNDGRFTGGAYPTFAAAAAYWAHAGPENELSEWALRWCRENSDESWTPWDYATALTFWAAVGIPAEHSTLEWFLNELWEEAPSEGWAEDPGLTLRTLELVRCLGI